MTRIVTVTLHGQPRGKGRPRRAGNSFHVYTPAATRLYESGLRRAASAAMDIAPPLTGTLRVAIIAFMAVPASWSRREREAALAGGIRPTARPDIDNLAKVIDALNRIVWRDDSQIVELSVRKIYSATPRLVIEAAELALIPSEASAARVTSSGVAGEGFFDKPLPVSLTSSPRAAVPGP